MTTDLESTQISAEAWVAPPEASLQVSQIVAEVWMPISTPTIGWNTQIVAEVWQRIKRPNANWETQFGAEVWIYTRALGLTYPIFPTLQGLSYSVFWQPEFANLPTQRSASKAEVDLALADIPIHEFELTFEFLRNLATPSPNEFKTLMGFFLRMKANVGRFLFLNPDDNRTTGEPVGTTDGTSTDYGPLQRTFGVGDNVGIEPVGYVRDDDLVNYPINVYFDGVLQSSGIYTIDKTFPCRQMLSFLIPPPAGKVITIDFSYYYYVKFPDEMMSFEKFMTQLWTVKRVTLRSLRYLT